jgi:uncharacterized membrane protein
METLIHADIFFFITSIFVLILIITFMIAMYFIIPILKDMRDLSRMAKEEGEKIVEDIADVRHAVKGEVVRVKSISDFFLDLFKKRQKKIKK